MTTPPSDLPGPQIEDLLALNEQVGPSAVCLCGKTIVRLGTGVWRSDEHPWGGDRIACPVRREKRHRPHNMPSTEIPFTTGDLP